jgi:hypothetical protein
MSYDASNLCIRPGRIRDCGRVGRSRVHSFVSFVSQVLRAAAKANGGPLTAVQLLGGSPRWCVSQGPVLPKARARWYVLITLGLEPAMKSVVCPAAWKEVRLWDTGRSWKLFDLGRDSIERFHAPYWFVHRGDLHRVLREAVLDAGVEINAKCESFEQDESGVTLKLVDGREARGDVRKPDIGAHAPAVAMQSDSLSGA